MGSALLCNKLVYVRDIGQAIPASVQAAYFQLQEYMVWMID
jgi:hypothetical protein